MNQRIQVLKALILYFTFCIHYKDAKTPTNSYKLIGVNHIKTENL